MRKIRFLSISILLFFSIIQKLNAQSGQFLQFWGGPQYVSIKNYDDYAATNYTNQRTSDNTYRWGGGLDYINNFSQNYGWQTGIYYSGQGQNYYGTVKNFYNPKDSALINYKSSVTMDYVRIPLMLRFNSILDDEDRINVSIFIGLQAGYLFNVTASTNPPAPDSILNKSNYRNFNFKQLYNTIDFGLGAGAQFNVRLNEKISANLGIRFDRSIINIENHSYELPHDAPVEYQYPLSAKKEVRLTQQDEYVHPASQHISVNVFLGLTYKLKNGVPPKPHPVDDLPPQ